MPQVVQLPPGIFATPAQVVLTRLNNEMMTEERRVVFLKYFNVIVMLKANYDVDDSSRYHNYDNAYGSIYEYSFATLYFFVIAT